MKLCLDEFTEQMAPWMSKRIKGGWPLDRVGQTRRPDDPSYLVFVLRDLGPRPSVRRSGPRSPALVVPPAHAASPSGRSISSPTC